MSPTPAAPLYLDHAAATPLCDEARDAMLRAYREVPANPSSISSAGRAAAEQLQGARQEIAASLGVRADTVIFTSGGTESNALAVLGVLSDRSGGHVVASAIEHASVLGSAALARRRGFEVTQVSPGPDGVVDPERFAAAVTPHTVLACLMHVNNELGTIQPLAEALLGVKRRAPRCLTLVDAVQSYGRLRVRPEEWQADLVSVSGHKVSGPRGIGALVARSRRPGRLFGGGEQEWGVRPGTQNVPGAVGFAAAARRALGRQGDWGRQAEALREAFLQGLTSRVPEARVNGSRERSVPWIVSVSVERISSEALLRGLEEHGVVVSAGAACHARSQKQSHVLEALGLPGNLGTARFSFGEVNTLDDVGRAVEALAATVERYRL